MKRVMCVWLPNWPLQRLVAARPELNGRAVALYAQAVLRGARNSGHPALPRGGRGPTIVARSAQAAALGVMVGMPLAEARTAQEERGTRSGERGAREGNAARVHPAPNSPLRVPSSLPHALHCELHDPLADRAALAGLAEWCGQFSPTVGLDEVGLQEAGWGEAGGTDGLLLDVTGLDRLFGGEEALAERVRGAFARGGFVVRAALGDTVGAAWARAHFGGRPPCLVSATADTGGTPVAPTRNEDLEGLPIEALRLSGDDARVLLELGVERIGQLAALPRAGLATRLGPGVLTRLDQALGRQNEVIVAHRPPPVVQADWPFEHPVDRREPLLAALEELIGRVVAELAGRRHGVTRLECLLYPMTGDVTRLSVGLFRPSGAARHLLELVLLRLERTPLPAEVAALRVEVAAAAPLECQQRKLAFGDEAGWEQGTIDEAEAARQRAALLDRLVSRLGREGVLRARPRAYVQPECAWQGEPWPVASGGQPRGRKKRASRQAAPDAAAIAPTFLWRPTRLPDRPTPIEVVSVAPDGPPIMFCAAGQRRQVRRAWGPERIETGWWRRRSAGRDYYRVADDHGGWFWLYRRLNDGRWFWHGTFE
jgi:protein ImuB